MNEELVNSIDNYLENFVDCYKERYSIALHNVNKYRCSIKQADYCLYMEIIDCIEQYCELNDISIDDIQEEIDFILL